MPAYIAMPILTADQEDQPHRSTAIIVGVPTIAKRAQLPTNWGA
jgi:hypothetical protein